MSARRQRGLTLIEVLAAIVIFSTGAVVLFGWIGQMADRLALIGKEEKLLFAELSALDFMRTLNPMQRPEGTETLAEASVRWQSQGVGDEAAVRNPGGAEGAYVVQLYRVSVNIVPDRAGPVSRELYLAGWRQTRPAGPSDLFANERVTTPGASP